MKKLVNIFILASLFAVMGTLLVETASAQTRRFASGRSKTVYVKRPNVYRRHRKAFNVGIGTGVGMLVGGLLGGGKGVVIGGLAGAGGGALFTHKQRPKNRVRYFRRY